MPQLDRAFEEDLDGYGPELVIIGGSVIAQEVPDAVLALHGGENGAGYLGEIGELLFKVFIFFGLGDEIDIGQGMGHFMEANIAIGCLTRDAAHEIIPGKIDARLVDMAHKRAGIEPVVIVIAKDEDIVEVVELELIKAQGKLNRGSAYKDGHFGRLFHLYIVEIFRMLEKPGAKEEFALILETQTVIIPEIPGHHRMVEGLIREKTLKLMSCVKSLTKQCDRTIKKQNPQHQ